MTSSKSSIYFSEGTPRGGKTFFVKYLTNKHLQTLGKKVILVTIIGAATYRLSCKVGTIHKYFRIPIQGYLYALQQPNATLQRIQNFDIIIIDEMSLLTNTLLNLVYMCIKQASFRINDPFVSKDLLVVGDMAQLPPICNHFVESSNDVCDKSYSKISIFGDLALISH